MTRLTGGQPDVPYLLVDMAADVWGCSTRWASSGRMSSVPRWAA